MSTGLGVEDKSPARTRDLSAHLCIPHFSLMLKNRTSTVPSPTTSHIGAVRCRLVSDPGREPVVPCLQHV